MWVPLLQTRHVAIITLNTLLPLQIDSAGTKLQVNELIALCRALRKKMKKKKFPQGGTNTKKQGACLISISDKSLSKHTCQVRFLINDTQTFMIFLTPLQITWVCHEDHY